MGQKISLNRGDFQLGTAVTSAKGEGIFVTTIVNLRMRLVVTCQLSSLPAYILHLGPFRRVCRLCQNYRVSNGRKLRIKATSSHLYSDFHRHLLPNRFGFDCSGAQGMDDI